MLTCAFLSATHGAACVTLWVLIVTCLLGSLPLRLAAAAVFCA